MDAFFKWANSQRTSPLGWVSIQGGRLDDFWIEDGSRAASAFVGFLHTGDGSRVGWWRPEGEPLAQAPIVFLGSEGQLSAVAATSAELLTKLAARHTGLEELDEIEGPADAAEDRERPPSRAALRAWLRNHGVWSEAESQLDHTTARLQAWFERWSETRLASAQASPERQAVAEVLQTIIGLPPPDQPWCTTFADLVITGTQCQLFGNFVGQKALPMTDSLETRLRAFRDHDAHELLEGGLWFRAKLDLDFKGRLRVSRHYLEEPGDGLVLEGEGLRRDAARMPRTPYWTPEWLARRLAG
jgi:hypothetical protein